MKRLLPLVLAIVFTISIVPTTFAKSAKDIFNINTKAGEQVVLFDEIAAAETTTKNYTISGTDFITEEGAYVYRFAADASGAIKAYAKNEIAWFNFGINVFDTNADADNVTMQAKAFAGTGDSLKLANAYVTAEKAFGMKVRSAENDTKIVFEIIINGADKMLANQFDAYLVISSAKADIKEAMSETSSEVIAPMGNSMAVSNVELFEVELEGGKIYPAKLKGNGRLWFMDNKFNVLANAWGEDAELALTPMTDGIYFVAVGGFKTTDKVTYSLGTPVSVGEFAIDLTKLANSDEHYAYEKYDDIAVLEIVEPGVYTLTGEAEDTVLYIHNAGIKVVLDNAKIANVHIEATGCVEIEAKGEAAITGNEKVDEPAAIYTTSNTMGMVAITGEKLTVTGRTGINLVNAALYIDAQMSVKTTGVGSENGVAAQVYGQFTPDIILGRPLDEDTLFVVPTYFDEAMMYQYGTAIAENSICIFGESEEATEFAMFEPLYGDANRDGVVNTADAVAILKDLVELTELTDKGMLNADVDLSEDVDTTDVTIILQYCADMIAELPVR